MRKIFPFLIISLIIAVFTGCFLMEIMIEEIYTDGSFRVYYHKGSADRGSVPIDNNKYEVGYSVVLQDKGTLEKENHMFLGWMNYGHLYSPGTEFIGDSKGKIHFTATWNDNLNSTFEFIIEDNEVKISKYKYAKHEHNDIVIPSIYALKPVTDIEDEVFKDKGIYSVALPKNLKRIGSSAFANCNISTLAIPDSLKSIGSYAFANCNITSLIFPDTLESIGDFAFDKNSINRITFGTGRTSIPRGVFKRNNIKSVSLPDIITLVEDEAFAENNISQIIIGANVEIESDTSFGTKGGSFKKFYDDSGKQAGEYGYTADFWVKL